MTTPPSVGGQSTTNMAARVPGTQRTVLITGVSRGLGKALALELARRGHTVIGCSRSQEKLKSLQADLNSFSTNSSSPSPSSVQNKHLVMNVDVVIVVSTYLL